jgi:hypothetical protein
MPDQNRFDLSPEQIQLLAQFATHPAVRKVLRDIEAAPPEERLATAERIATAENLAAQGLTIPPGLKITTRYFEDPRAVVRGDVMLKPTKEQFAEAGGGTVCISVGEIVCGSYGWEAAQ